MGSTPALAGWVSMCYIAPGLWVVRGRPSLVPRVEHVCVMQGRDWGGWEGQGRRKKVVESGGCEMHE
jgi:hypothetical protein